MRKLIVISAAIHLGLLVFLPLFPSFGPREPLALDVYAVELVDLPAPAPVEPPQEQPVDEPEQSPPVQEPEPEESPIPEEPAHQQPARKLVPPPPRIERKTLEERLAERLKDTEPQRPREDQARQDEPEPQQPTGTTKITAGKVADYYLTMLQGKITRNWKQPSVRFAGGGGLTARVTFRVLRSGEITAISLARSSGWTTVDQSALQAVRASAPLAELPASYTSGHLDVTVDFTVTQQGESHRS
jgi:protein TonB